MTSKIVLGLIKIIIFVKTVQSFEMKGFKYY